MPPSQSRPVEQDAAPWFIKELRPYGLGGLALSALCWLGFSVINWQQARIEAKDQLLESLNTASIQALENNAKSNWEYAASNARLAEAVKELNKGYRN